jgi:predicted DNA-binding transcriptional regulator YafY
MVYYVDVTLIAAWCELRQDYRHFRVERIQSSEILEDKFPADNGRLLSGWLALQNASVDESQARLAGTGAASSGRT